MSTITTIIPTFNRSNFLVRAISSVQKQSWADIHIVVRDNCSTDDTEFLVKNIALHDARLCYKKNIRNLGSYLNCKQGLDEVSTEYFTFLCDDDYLEPGFYSEAMRLFEKYPQAGFVAFRVNTVDINEKFINTNIKNFRGQINDVFYTPDVGLESYLKGELPTTLTGYIFKKSVADSIDFADFSEVGYGLDIHFIFHAASRFDFVVSSFLAGNYTTHSNNCSTTQVDTFDERFLYWWRNRMNIILTDPQVNDSVKKIVTKYYFLNSTKSIKGIKYYTHAATILILDKIKNERLDELKYDFIKMRSFVPWTILILIKYSILLIVSLKLDTFLRNFIRRTRYFLR